VTKADNSVEMAMLEACIREDLDKNAPRAMAVLNPLKIVLENFPEGEVEELSAPNHPKDDSMGSRTLKFTREIYIDRADFREEANKKYKRMVTGGEVRLRNAYVIKCEQVIKDESGEITELRCSYDPDTLGANPVGRKVRGVIHWVSASEGIEAEVRVYDNLFNHPTPDGDREVESFIDHLNPESLTTLTNCVVESSLANSEPGSGFQFEREGYFCVDSIDSSDNRLVFNRTVTLRDSWAKIEHKS
jgi:glutaminyl-tRNA synthetase